MNWLFNKILASFVQFGFRKLSPEVQDQVRAAINDTYPDGPFRRAKPVLNSKGTPVVHNDLP